MPSFISKLFSPKKKAPKKEKQDPIKLDPNVFLSQTSMTRTSTGRIVSENDDKQLTRDDYQMFSHIVEKFEHDTYQVSKITNVTNINLEKIYVHTFQEFSARNVSTDQVLVFHGTTIDAIPKILIKGFKVGGKDGHPVKNGCRFGNGIYTSKNGETPILFTDDTCLIACIGIMGEKDVDHFTVKDFSQWIIFNDWKQLLPCYVIFFSRKKKYSPLLPLPQQYGYRETINYIDNQNHQDTEVVDTTKQTKHTDHDGDAVEIMFNELKSVDTETETNLSGKTVKSIQKQLKNMLKIQMNTVVTERGWTLITNGLEHLNVWTLTLSHFDPHLKLAKDLAKNKLTSVVLEIRFPEDYPTLPPFVRILYPRLLRFMNGGGGHVTAGGGICMEMLTTSGWNCDIQIESIVQIVHMLLSTKNPPARLDKDWNKTYTLMEAKDSFIRVAKDHQWL